MVKNLSRALVVVIVLFMMTSVVSGIASASTLKDVRLVDNGVSAMHFSFSSTVGEFLEENDIVLHPTDMVNLDLDYALSVTRHFTTIEIVRGITITLTIDDETDEVRLPAGTITGLFIRDLEQEKDTQLFFEGRTSEILQDGHEVILRRITRDERVKTLQIPFETIKESDDTLYKGETETVQAGSPGMERIVTTVTRTQEAIVNEETTREVMTEPVAATVRVGTKVPPTPLEVRRQNGRRLMMEATAYTAHYSCTGKRPGDPGYRITASGIPVGHGIVAVDTSVIPFGTQLYIEGYGLAVAADRGGAIRGHKIDLFFECLDAAREFGRRQLAVYILGEA